MAKGNFSRREMLVRGAGLLSFCAALPLASKGAAAAGAMVCEPPDAADSSLRMSLHYTEAGPDKNMVCGKCALFTPAGAGCGQCMIFNGPANPVGHCDSWSAKQ